MSKTASGQNVESVARFALIGAAGYVAPRHINAICETGQRLVVAMDPSDSVGVLDSYFPDSAFFTEFERFDRHVDKLRRKPGQDVQYVSVCSPNYLHDAHIRFGLRSGADVICEKPLVLNPWNLDGLEVLERETGRRVNNILQLRLHPSLLKLKEQLAHANNRHTVDLRYVTPRGVWYQHSWKGDVTRSGGVATNIGIHFFDMLIWLFGAAERSEVHALEPDRAAGALYLANADVRWFLSTNARDLPTQQQDKMQPFRSISVDGREVEFSSGFRDLHTLSYEQILAGQGFGLAESRPSIELVHDIRNASPVGSSGFHPAALDAR